MAAHVCSITTAEATTTRSMYVYMLHVNSMATYAPANMMDIHACFKSKFAK
jgi:hypothetical protein